MRFLVMDVSKFSLYLSNFRRKKAIWMGRLRRPKKRYGNSVPHYNAVTPLVRCGVHLHVRTCTPLSHDGASTPARPSPIKASYWYIMVTKDCIMLLK